MISMKFRKASEGEEIHKKDYSKRVIFSLADYEEKGHLLQEVIIPPQTKQRKHVHQFQTETSYLLEGEVTFVVNDKVFEMHAGDAIIHPHGETHFVWNKTDKPAKILVFKINFPENSDDTEWLEG